MTKVLYLRVPDDVHALVVRLAAETGSTISSVATRLIYRGAGRRDVLNDALDRLHREGDGADAGGPAVGQLLERGGDLVDDQQQMRAAGPHA
jgi:hypothetical protein